MGQERLGGCAAISLIRPSERAGWFLPSGSTLPALGGGVRCGLWVAATAGALAGSGEKLIPLPEDTGFVEASSLEPGHIIGCHHGTRFGRLAYVVFQKGAKVSMVHPDEMTGLAVLPREGGPDLELPGPTQLHEVIDGRYRTTDRTVTLEQLRRFLSRSPEEYTIDALLRSAGGG